VYAAPLGKDHYAGRLTEWNALFKTALEHYVSEGLDLSDYDSNGDGYLDGRAVKFACSGWGAYTMRLPNVDFDGIKIGRYTYTYANVVRIVDWHEFGHVLGLPDNYNVNGTQCVTDLKLVELMGGGTGAYFNMYSKYVLEWIDPVTLTNGNNKIGRKNPVIPVLLGFNSFVATLSSFI